MGGASPLLWLACALGAAGVGALRRAWARPRRSAVANGAGWGLLALSALIAGLAEGAWGMSVAALTTMLAAFAALAIAAWRSPPARAKASNRRAGMLPEAGEPRRIGRRVATFLLVIVAGLVASIALALALRGLGGALGWSEANANVLALYSVPVTWAVLAFVLLMQQSRRSQVLTLLMCCVPALPVLLNGAL